MGHIPPRQGGFWRIATIGVSREAHRVSMSGCENKKLIMKTILLLIAAVALVGCGQGGTDDQYDTGTGSGRYDVIGATNNVAPEVSPSVTDTNNTGLEVPSPTP